MKALEKKSESDRARWVRRTQAGVLMELATLWCGMAMGDYFVSSVQWFIGQDGIKWRDVSEYSNWLA
jgi:hypothetical protein